MTPNRCDGCEKIIGPAEETVYADDGETYHLGCDLVGTHDYNNEKF